MAQQVSIYGYRWFQSTYGNTYHTVIVFVDGEEVYRSSEMEYGYDNQYEVTGFREYLAATNQDHPDTDDGRRPVFPWRYFNDRGIDYETKSYDVKRKRDLFTFQPFGGQVRTSGNELA